jgi:hypothetical protein
MTTPVICRDVRSEIRNDQARLVIVASQDEPESVRSVDVTDEAKMSELKAKLASQGIVLGGPSVAGKPRAPSNLCSSTRLTAQDERGRKHLLIADCAEEYQLSSGSILYYFYIPDAPGDYRWLVGRTLNISEGQQSLDGPDDAPLNDRA